MLDLTRASLQRIPKFVAVCVRALPLQVGSAHSRTVIFAGTYEPEPLGDREKGSCSLLKRVDRSDPLCSLKLRQLGRTVSAVVEREEGGELFSSGAESALASCTRTLGRLSKFSTDSSFCSQAIINSERRTNRGGLNAT